MNRIRFNPISLAVILFSLLSLSTSAHAETKPADIDKTNVRVPIEGGIVQRLEKAGLHPAVPQKIDPSKGFKMPEVPKAIQNENLSTAGHFKMDQSERKRAEGKSTETEYDIEKDDIW